MKVKLIIPDPSDASAYAGSSGRGIHAMPVDQPTPDGCVVLTEFDIKQAAKPKPSGLSRSTRD